MGFETHSEHSEFKLQFRIEQLPDGTFVGISEQPHLEIKGATREEVLKKIEDSLGSRLLGSLGIDLAASLTSGGVQVRVDRKLSVTRRNFDGSVSDLSSPAELSGAPMTAKPIDSGSFVSQELITAFLVLAAIGVLVWWFFFR